MTKPFDMALFLSGVLTGSRATQQRHLRQARIMQAAIQQRWQRDNPWTWRHKHLRWFLAHHLRDRSEATRYYYRLTTILILKRMDSSPGCLVTRAWVSDWGNDSLPISKCPLIQILSNLARRPEKRASGINRGTACVDTTLQASVAISHLSI